MEARLRLPGMVVLTLLVNYVKQMMEVTSRTQVGLEALSSVGGSGL